jgi:hypothetical protein
MTVQRNQETQSIAPKSPTSPADATRADEPGGAEMGDDMLDRVSGGFPPDPC